MRFFRSKGTIWLKLLCILIVLSPYPSWVEGGKAIAAQSGDFHSGSGTAGDPYIITTAEQFNRIRDHLTAHFKLGMDIDMSAYPDWEPIISRSKEDYFNGTLDGGGHIITGFNQANPTKGGGLFAALGTRSKVSNFSMTGVTVIGRNNVGALAGHVAGVIENVHVSGLVRGARDWEEGGDHTPISPGSVIGGLVGSVTSGAVVRNSSFTGTVGGTWSVGGITGLNSGSIEASSATGEVNSNYSAGGLVGDNEGMISESYAAGQVSANISIGGLAGTNEGKISNSYSTGVVTVRENPLSSSTSGDAGGLVGYSKAGPEGGIYHSFATGSISYPAALKNQNLGELVGRNNAPIHSSYAVENVEGLSFTGLELYSVTDNSGLLPPEEMQRKLSFSEWDFASVWAMEEGREFPKLRSFLPEHGLQGIRISTGELNLPFQQDVLDYSVLLPYGTKEIVLSVELDRYTELVIHKNGETVTSQDNSYRIPLDGSSAVVSLEVREPNGSLSVYRLQITVKDAIAGVLDDLQVSQGGLTPGFEAQIFDYRVDVGFDTEEIELMPSSSQGVTYTVEHQGQKLVPLEDEEGSGYRISLMPGREEVVTIFAKSPETGTGGTYTVTIRRATDGVLSGLELGTGNLNKTFDPAVLHYEALIGYDVSELVLKPIVANGMELSVMYEGEEIPLNENSGYLIKTAPGKTGVVSIQVISPLTDTGETYELKIIRAPESDGMLTTLGVSAGNLSPAFHPQTLSYRWVVDNTVEQLRMTPTAENGRITVTRDGKPLNPSAGSIYPFSLTAGVTTTIEIKVISNLTNESQTYHLEVTRVLATDGMLTGIQLSSGKLSPEFHPQTKSYSVEIANKISVLKIKPAALNATVSLELNGEVIAPGSNAEYSIPLSNEGRAEVKIKVVSTLTGVSHEYILNILQTASDFDGGTGSADNPWLIATPKQLDNIRLYQKEFSHYKLVKDINLDEYLSVMGEGYNGREGWKPIPEFDGILDGDGHIISGLRMDYLADQVGLFGKINASSEVRNLGLENVSIHGNREVGALSGISHGIIRKVYVTGSLDNLVMSGGGLVGYNYGTIEQSYSTANISGTQQIGGLVGILDEGGNISSSFSSGNIKGNRTTGGLAGIMINSSIENSYSTGSVQGGIVGGLVGEAGTGRLSSSYSTASITSISGVEGPGGGGGLAGKNFAGNIAVNNYWNKQLSGQNASPGGGTGLTSKAMKQPETYHDWDFEQVWTWDEGKFPILRGIPLEVQRDIAPPFLLQAEIRTSNMSQVILNFDEPVIMVSNQYFSVQVNGSKVQASSVSSENMREWILELENPVPMGAKVNISYIDLSQPILDQAGNALERVLMMTASYIYSDDTSIHAMDDHYSITAQGITGNAVKITEEVTVERLLEHLGKHTAARWKVIGKDTVIEDAGQFDSITSKDSLQTLDAGDRLVVLAEDNQTMMVYPVHVLRVRTLSGLALNHGGLNPAFDENNFVYSVHVGYDVEELELKPEAEDGVTFEVAVDGSSVTPDGDIYRVPLAAEVKHIVTLKIITPSMQEGETYTVTVMRSAAKRGVLNGLHVSEGNLSPAFAEETLAYQVSVPNSVYSLNIEAMAIAEVLDTLLVEQEGVEILKEGFVYPVQLKVGANEIIIRATSPDTLEYSLYKIIIIRAAEEEPGNPGGPDEPGNPGNPGNPGGPDEPGNPGNPGNPGSPGNSGNSGGSGTPLMETSPGQANPYRRETIIGRGESGKLSMNDDIVVIIPPGAMEGTIRYTAEQIRDPEILKLLQSKGELWISSIYEILKNVEGSFKSPVTIRLRFDPDQLGEYQRPSIHYYDEIEQTWVEMGGTIVGGNFIEVESTHLTKFAVFAVSDASQSTKPVEMPIVTFTDIDNHWATDEIAQAVAAGIVNGYPDGTFKPNTTVTRAEFTVMLAKALRLSGEGVHLPYTDQASIGDWARKAVALASEAGIVQGSSEGRFEPGTSITRAQMAVMIANAMGKDETSNGKLDFADANEIPNWATEAVALVSREELMTGRIHNRFDSGEPVTRAEAVTVLIRLLKKQ